MTYTQKYTIVQFLEPVANQQVFLMEDWPIHITLADVFAVELGSSLFEELAAFLDSESIILVETAGKADFGTDGSSHTVTLLDKTPRLQSFHIELVELLQKHGAVFSYPQFSGEGFVPHVTDQKHAKLEKGDKVRINELCLVDMFVDGDWRTRKVLKSFKLGA